MKKFLIPAIIFLAMTFISCSSPTDTTTSGINGIVMIGPVSPVEKEGEINEKPYPDAVIFVMDLYGRKKITEIRSDKDGFFKTYLVAGKYLLYPQTPKDQILPVGEIQEVQVLNNLFTYVTILYDSGIR